MQRLFFIIFILFSSLNFVGSSLLSCFHPSMLLELKLVWHRTAAFLPVFGKRFSWWTWSFHQDHGHKRPTGSEVAILSVKRRCQWFPTILFLVHVCGHYYIGMFANIYDPKLLFHLGFLLKKQGSRLVFGRLSWIPWQEDFSDVYFHCFANLGWIDLFPGCLLDALLDCPDVSSHLAPRGLLCRMPWMILPYGCYPK